MASAAARSSPQLALSGQAGLELRAEGGYLAVLQPQPPVGLLAANGQPVLAHAAAPKGMKDQAASDEEATSHDEEPKGPAGSSDEACSTSETGEWEDDERPFPIRSIITRDFFDDTPLRSASVRTLDPFDDTPMHGDWSEPTARWEPPPLLSQCQSQACNENDAIGTEGVAAAARAALGVAPAAKIQVRNTFVHFSDGEGDDDTPSLRPGAHRRARATRTVPARILECMLPHEEESPAELSSAGTSPLPSPLGGQPQPPQQQPQQPPQPPQQQPPQPPQQPPQPPQMQQPSRTQQRDEPPQQQEQPRLCAAGAAHAAARKTARFDSGAPVTIGSPSPAAAAPAVARAGEKNAQEAALPEPMYVGHAHSENGPRLTVSVRNTFLHIDEEADGTEQTPVLHRRDSRRSKTGPPDMLHAFDEVSDDSDEGSGRMASGAEQPHVATPAAQQQPQGAAAATAWPPMAVPPVAGAACVPMAVSLQPGLAPFFPGFPQLASILAPIAAAQALQLAQAVAPQAAQQPEVRVAQPSSAAAAGAGAAKRSPTQRTTVVLQNLPLNYRRPMLLRMLDAEGFSGEYDFVYLPMDFKTRAGFGYAFVNLVDPSLVPRFWATFDGYSKWMFPSAKVCRVSWSEPHQGLKAHIKRYRSSPIMHESVPDEYRPVLFSGGVRVAFPPPLKEITAPSQRVLAKGSSKKGGRRQGAAA